MKQKTISSIRTTNIEHQKRDRTDYNEDRVGYVMLGFFLALLFYTTTKLWELIILIK